MNKKPKLLYKITKVDPNLETSRPYYIAKVKSYFGWWSKLTDWGTVADTYTSESSWQLNTENQALNAIMNHIRKKIANRPIVTDVRVFTKDDVREIELSVKKDKDK